VLNAGGFIWISDRYRGDIETTRTIYGHEQRHVLNLRRYARNSSTAENLRASYNGCYRPERCDGLLNFLVNFYTIALVSEIEAWGLEGDDGGGDHWLPPREPRNGLPYDPIGDMPLPEIEP
jgi:hypothetical protein